MDAMVHKIHPLAITFNTDQNKVGNDDLLLCVFDTEAETQRGTFITKFPVGITLNYMIKEVNKTTFFSCNRIESLVFEVTEIAYKTENHELITSVILESTGEDIFSEKYIFQKTEVRKGIVNMVCTLQNINYIAILLEQKPRQVSSQIFNKALVSYLNTFLVTDNFEKTDKFKEFYSKLIF